MVIYNKDLIEKEKALRYKSQERNTRNGIFRILNQDLEDTYGTEIGTSRACLDRMYSYCENFGFTPDDLVFSALEVRFTRLVADEKKYIRQRVKKPRRTESSKDMQAREEKNKLDEIVNEYNDFRDFLEPLRWAFFRVHRTHARIDFDEDFPELDDMNPSYEQLNRIRVRELKKVYA